MAIPLFLDPQRAPPGKARGLHLLQKSGLPVPPWKALDARHVASRAWGKGEGAWLAIQREAAGLAGPHGIMVRSAAAAEDSRYQSFAGRCISVHVSDLQGLARALDTVASSLKQVPAGNVPGRASTIILQTRVEPIRSGVLFSTDPTAARPDRCLVELVSGHLAGLASGSVTPTRYAIDRASTGAVRSHMPPEAEPSCRTDLGEDARTTLLAALPLIEDALDSLVDVEWAEDEEGIWFLQARPITVAEPDPSLLPRECSTSWFFDQRFREPVSPLTRTFLAPLIVRYALTEPLEMLGHEAPMDVRTWFGGQLYVPHDLYRRMLGGVPTWLLPPDLRGLRPRECLCEPHRSAQRPRWSIDAFLMSLRDHGREIFRNVQAWEEIREEIRLRLPEVRARWLATEEWSDALDASTSLSERLLAIHRFSIFLADYGLAALRAAASPLPESIRRTLESRLFASLKLPTVAANTWFVRHLEGQRHGSEASVLEPSKVGHHIAPSENPSPEEPGSIEAFGHRSPSLDLAIGTWRELLDAEVKSSSLRPLPSRPPRPSDEERPTPPIGLGWLARFLEMREEQRFEWERILAFQREVLLGLGRSLVEKGSLPSTEDIWLLEWDELLAWAADPVPIATSLLAARRHQLRLERLFDRPLFLGPRLTPMTLAPRTEWTGVPVSAGEAKGIAFALPDTSEIPDIPCQAILIAGSLDPAMTWVLERVQGVVLERGGVLSHAAILAREYRVPMVTGVERARELAGKEIIVDGSRGTLRLA